MEENNNVTPIRSLEEGLRAGTLALRQAVTDSALFVVSDEVNDSPRFCCFRIEGDTVTGVVVFLEDSRGSDFSVQIGYEVPQHLRGRGRAKELVAAALKEFDHLMSGEGIVNFRIEAIIDENNLASQHVAEATISTVSRSITDPQTGRPARKYIRMTASSVSPHCSQEKE